MCNIEDVIEKVSVFIVEISKINAHANVSYITPPYSRHSTKYICYSILSAAKN